VEINEPDPIDFAIDFARDSGRAASCGVGGGNQQSDALICLMRQSPAALYGKGWAFYYFKR
jgi:hypothetical protein